MARIAKAPRKTPARRASSKSKDPMQYSTVWLNSRMAAMTQSTDSERKTSLYEAIGRVALALGSAGRLQILEFVAQRERSVDELARMTGLSVANTSKHLQALRQAGLVTARKEGLRVYYSLAGDDVVALLSALRAVAEQRVAEVERLVRLWLAHRDEMEPIPAAELLAR